MSIFYYIVFLLRLIFIISKFYYCYFYYIILIHRFDIIQFFKHLILKNLNFSNIKFLKYSIYLEILKFLNINFSKYHLKILESYQKYNSYIFLNIEFFKKYF